MVNDLIPLGSGLMTVSFDKGDCPMVETDRERVVEQAKKEGALQVPGSPRAMLFALQASLGALPPVETFLQHLFPPGLYMRTISMPANTVLVGKIHKHRHGNILSKGKVVVYTEGGGSEVLEGPLQMVSEPGTKRAVVALTDCVWTTLHLNPTDTQDLAELERDIIAETFEEYEAFVKKGIV